MPATQRIKVTHVLTQPELGGAQANTLYTVRNLDRREFAPSLITSPDGPLAGEMAAIPDAEVAFVPALVGPIRPVQDWRAGRELCRLLRAFRPDIVHTHSSKAGILGRWAASRTGVPMIVHTVHGFPFHDRQPRSLRRLYITLERAAARRTDRFVCVSRADIAKGERHGIFGRHQVTLIRSGIELSSCRRAHGQGKRIRAELGLPADAPLVGMVACFKPQKDPVTFVRVAARVRQAVPRARFLLVGDGSLRTAVERVRAEEGLQDALVLTGWRRDIPEIMDACDVMVLTSLHEGLPRVVPEAMACGRPMVATAVDGTPEAVAEGVTGYLFRPGDVDTAAERIIRLLGDPEAARRLGNEALGRAPEFDIGEMVRRQEQMYRELMGVTPTMHHARA